MSTHTLFFEGEVDPITRRRTSLFSNTLVLPGFNIYEALKLDDPKKLAWKEHIIDLRGRHLEQAVLAGADLTKADLTGAHLQGASLHGARLRGASLDEAQLQGASLEDAELQGASLEFAQLQGAWLDRAELQGASLWSAQLQGASLSSAQLQGASLSSAQLQGVSLDRAELQGASLDVAQLQGASLSSAQLQGASLSSAQLQGAALYSAQLQGVSLDGAEVRATDFSGAFLWRTQWWLWRTEWWGLVRIAAVRLNDPIWKPVLEENVPWDAKAYGELRDSMKSIPEDKMREAALGRIEILDCGNPDKTLASCDPAVKPPRKVLDWQKKLEAASVDDSAYEKAIATELRSLVCGNEHNAIYILRGLMRSERLIETNREAPALVDFIMSKDCPVSAALTDNDKARLLKIKQVAEKNFPPAPASKQDK